MSYSEEAPFPEPFGPEYVRPEPAPCPSCGCCSARLCQRAASTGLTCVACAPPADREIVVGCLCSAGAR